MFGLFGGTPSKKKLKKLKVRLKQINAAIGKLYKLHRSGVNINTPHYRKKKQRLGERRSKVEDKIRQIENPIWAAKQTPKNNILQPLQPLSRPGYQIPYRTRPSAPPVPSTRPTRPSPPNPHAGEVLTGIAAILAPLSQRGVGIYAAFQQAQLQRAKLQAQQARKPGMPGWAAACRGGVKGQPLPPGFTESKYITLNPDIGPLAKRRPQGAAYHYSCSGWKEKRKFAGLGGLNRPGYLSGIFANWDHI